MPFGLCNAPATFQRLMQNCLGELNLMYCWIYLDDVIVFSKMKEEHLQCLGVVFKCFWEHNLKLKLSKCEFFHNEINYLVHHVSKEGVQSSKGNLKSCGWICPASDIHWNMSLSGLGRSLPVIHQGICMGGTTTAWTLIWRRCWQEEWLSNTH